MNGRGHQLEIDGVEEVDENEKNEKKEAGIFLCAIGLVTEGSMEVKAKN